MPAGIEIMPPDGDLDAYLARFGHGRDLSIQDLWAEMDRVWDELGLDNRRPLAGQRIGDFYAHPVWVLNGLFAETDPASAGHRQAIAAFLGTTFPDRAELSIADYGGGSGLLARRIAECLPGRVVIEIIEPFPADYFRRRLAGQDGIRFRDALSADGYDVMIAQDVLEHVEQPIATALCCIEATRVGGLLLFANCFHPFIRCHLPATFYLRHTFRHVLGSRALTYLGGVPGAPHALAFRKYGRVDSASVRRRDRVARLVGPLLNQAGRLRARLKSSACAEVSGR